MKEMATEKEVMKEKPTEVQVMKGNVKKSEISVIASSIWGSSIVIALAIIVGSTGIAFALMRSNMFVTDDAIAPSKPSAEDGVAPTAQAPTPEQKKTTATISIGSSPVLGDKKKAKVAIVKWSDFECPFCKKFHEDSYDALVKKYVNVGEVVFVFKNLPLDFHGEAAIQDANAALCVREVAGDKAFFKMMDDIYTNTAANGKGVSQEKLSTLAKSAAGKSVDTCLSDQRFKDVIDADVKNAASVGIQATPSFVIGMLSPDGTISGDIVEGALPLDQFEEKIDSMLDSKK